jgi:hypothetical protein
LFLATHRRLIRTANSLWSGLVVKFAAKPGLSLFPNEPDFLRLISAILMEISDEWKSCKLYLTFEDGIS